MRIFVDDITCQKLTSVMVENEGRMSILSAEGGIFDIMDGRYNSNKPDIDIFLKGFSGDTIKIDRISRESEEIISPVLMSRRINPTLLPCACRVSCILFTTFTSSVSRRISEDE